MRRSTSDGIALRPRGRAWRRRSTACMERLGQHAMGRLRWRQIVLTRGRALPPAGARGPRQRHGSRHHLILESSYPAPTLGMNSLPCWRAHLQAGRPAGTGCHPCNYGKGSQAADARPALGPALVWAHGQRAPCMATPNRLHAQAPYHCLPAELWPVGRVGAVAHGFAGEVCVEACGPVASG